MKRSIKIDDVEVGYVRYSVYINQSTTLYINQFFIHPEHRHQNKGYFRKMLDETILIAKNLGCPSLTLNFGSLEESDDYLIELYSRHGFKQTSSRWMKKDLN